MQLRNNKSILFWINIALLIVLIALAGFIGWKQFLKPNLDKNKPADKSQQVTQPKKGPAVSDATAGWKTYTDAKNGFSFKYPSDVEVNNPDKAEIGVTVSVQDIKTMEDAPAGWGVAVALEDELALKKGDPTTRISWGHDYKIIPIKGALAKRFVVSGRYEVCDVEFDQYALIYRGDTRIIISYNPSNLDDIIKNNPQYFINDPSNGCNRPIWKENNTFYQDVVAGKTDALSQTAYRNFNGMIQSFKFIQSNQINSNSIDKTDISANWKTYTDSRDSYELKYPKTWLVDREVATDDVNHTTIKSGKDAAIIGEVALTISSSKTSDSSKDYKPSHCDKFSEDTFKWTEKTVQKETYTCENGDYKVVYHSIKSNDGTNYWVIATQSGDDSAIATIDNILSTFKFTN